MQAALAPRLVRNMSDDWEEKNAKMESCQSKDDKCGGKVEQIFSSEKEQKEQSAGEPWADFAYWKMLKVMYEIYQINPNPSDRSTWVQYIMSMSWDSIISNQCFALNLFCRSVISN